MSSRQLTPLDPHQVRLHGIQLIEASAGTGKTFNISALYARMVLETGLPVHQLLVLTFTKAAAAELRDRVRQRLVEVLAACAQDPGQAPTLPARLLADACLRTGLDQGQLEARLRLAVQSFDQAAIHTIHGFCQRALADAPLVAGVPLEAELLPDDQELAAAVLCDAWRARMAAHPLPAPLAIALLEGREGPVEIARLLRRHQAKPLAGVRWPDCMDQAEAQLAQGEAGLQAIWRRLQACWPTERAAITGQLLARLPGLSKRSYSEAAIELAAAEWDALMRAGTPWARLKDLPRLALFTASRAQPTQAGLRAGVLPPDHSFFAIADAFLAQRETLDRAVRHTRAALLQTLIDQALPALAQRKRQARVQTYDDLLTGLHAALAGPRREALAASLRARYPLALVDEFQDTDPVQWAILRAVYQAPDLALFLVGDPKQAIYAFRNADLHCYLDARSAAGNLWTLADNQRASPELIDGLNAVFGCSPRPFLIDGLPYPAVAPGRKPRLALLGDPLPRAALQLWLLPRSAEGGPALQADARGQALAVCADEIVRLLTEADRGLRLGERPLRAGDIAVLVRSHRDGQAMRAALAGRGVASVELSQASVFSSLEAEDLLQVLAAVADPADPGRILAALATSLLGGSAERVDEVRQDEGQFATWMGEFSAGLTRWQGRGFAAMFWPLAERHGMVQRLLASPEGARRLTNLRHLAELLHAAASEHPAPAALLAWLRARIEAPDGDEARQLRLDSDAGLVQIVTVHRAKGLEYPVVFCPVLWAPARPDGREQGVREYHHAGQAWIDYRDDSDLDAAELDEIKAARAQDRFGEDLRLIYVALTRAANRCYLVAGAWRNRRGGPVCSSAARTALAWLAEPLPPPFADWQKREAAAGMLDDQWRAIAARLDRPAALAVEVLPEDRGRRWQTPPADPARLQALPPPRIPARRRIGSYTALVSGRQASGGEPQQDEPALDQGARDHDMLALPSPVVTATTLADIAPAFDILSFPRGAEAGTCLHSVLENVDFSRPRSWPAAVAGALAVHAPWLGVRPAERAASPYGPMLQAWLADLAATALPPGFRLADLDPRHCLRELEFHLPVASLDAAGLRSVLARHQQAAPLFRFDPLHGHLKGFIDLVVEHQGRWYVIDWKSNHLGNRPEDYAPECVQRAIDQHDYALQALIYLLALDRLLARRLTGYDPERHLGGALYLFVRGVRPGWRAAGGEACACWFLPAPLDALADLSAALDGQHPEPLA